MSDTKKYYWLKLKRDFFKRHDITVIESMQNGDKYLLFYMKLLVEGIDHEGALRFSDTVPYNDTMLAAITRTDIDIVRSAVKIFQQFGMMDLLDDGTLYMKQVETMIGDETEWAEKKRLYREKQKLIETAEGQKRTMSDKSKSKSKSKSIDKEEEEEPGKPVHPQAVALSSLLFTLHKEQDPKYNVSTTQLANWAGDIEKIARLDGRGYDEIERVLRWAKSDGFWRPNIMSGKKLREKFPTLYAQMTTGRKQAQKPGLVAIPSPPKQDDEFAQFVRSAE